MRRTLRLLANVKPQRYLEPGMPTGLTGLTTHPTPRAALLFLYSKTLEKLKAVPESAVYRQSVEAVTRHRMAIVEAAEPAGWEAWRASFEAAMRAYEERREARALARADREAAAEGARRAEQGRPRSRLAGALTPFRLVTGMKTAGHHRQATVMEKLNRAPGSTLDGTASQTVAVGDKVFWVKREKPEADDRYEEWDGEVDEGPENEGVKTEEDTQHMRKIFERQPEWPDEQLDLPREPQWTLEQIEEVEKQIGAGLIEEVIQVAEGELRAVDTMIEAKVWEPLEEKPAEGQWVYFERSA